MKKAKLAALFTALILSVTAFTACGKKDNDGDPAAQNNWETLKLGDVYSSTFDETADADYYKDNYAKYKRANVTELSGYVNTAVSYSSSRPANYSVLTVFTKYSEATDKTEYKLYNLTQNKTVKTFSYENVKSSYYGSEGTYVNIKYLTASSYPYYAYAVQVETRNLSTGDQTRTIYGLDGTLITDKQTVSVGSTKFITESDDDGNDEYFVEFALADSADDNFAASYTANVFTGETKATVQKQPENEFKNFDFDYNELGDYNVLYDYNLGFLYFYNKESGALVSTLDMSDATDSSAIAPLASGKILYQNAVLVDPYATDYAFAMLESGECMKFNLKSYLFNPADGSKTEVKLDFVVTEVLNTLTDEEEFKKYQFNASVENVAEVARIENKTIVYNAQVVLSNDLKVIGRIDNYVPDQSGIPQIVGDGIFEVKCGGSHSSAYYINADGVIIGKMFASGSYTAYTRDFVGYNNAIYSVRTLENVIDLTAENYTASVEKQDFGGSLVVRKTYTSADGVETYQYVLIKRDSSKVSMYNTADTALVDYGVGSNDYFYVEKLEGGDYRYTYKDTDGETIYEYTSKSYSDTIATVGYEYSCGGVSYRIERLKTTDADGNYAYSYYRVTK